MERIKFPVEQARKRVITFGVFDYFHFGHLNLFNNIKRMCGEDCYLIVCVQASDWILKYKPEAKILYTTQERVAILKELKVVDEVIIFTEVDVAIQKIGFDIWARGPEHNHLGAFKFCRENDKEIITIPRTAGISSTIIKQLISDLEK
ncbi:MAG: adenylyltransferase/cytidyltransferase family protein [Fibrobacter sp.]|jgi:cytidyltransferase-like protein|nr:adenylyltransferase/cytidyltransferase family protein [Fibrobacter sp.]